MKRENNPDRDAIALGLAIIGFCFGMGALLGMSLQRALDAFARGAQ